MTRSVGRFRCPDVLLARRPAYFGTPDDPMLVALLAQTQGCIELAAGKDSDAAASFVRARESAISAGGRLLAVECNEDLALALVSVDPSNGQAVALVAAATDERDRIGTPRPASRTAALQAHAGLFALMSNLK